MPGSNWNSINTLQAFEDIIQKWITETNEKIDTDQEFKNFEDVVDNTKSRETFINAVSKDETKVLNLFDEKELTKKINNVNKWKSTVQSKEVQDAYKALWAYKAGKIGTYTQVLDQLESETPLDQSKKKLLKLIKNNKDWDKNLKQTAVNVVEDLFNECNTVEEFERRAGIRLGTIEGMDNIWDFFKATPKFITYTVEKTVKQWWEALKSFMSLTKKLWYSMYDIGKVLIEQQKIWRNNFLQLCEAEWRAIKEIISTVCWRWKEKFQSFLKYLKEKWEYVSEALNAAWEWTWKQWNNFVEFCSGARDEVKAFWINLVKKWELLRNTMLEWLKSHREEVKDVAKTLIEAWLIKLHDFADRCKWVWEKWKELIIGILERNKQLVKDFVNRCTENWESAKSWFKDVCKSMLEKWKMLVSEFVELCKNSWELVKETACNVLVSLVAAWKIALRVAFDALIVLPAVAVAELTKLLITAWKEVFKKTAELGKYIGELAIIWREKAKSLWNTFVDYMKWVMDTIKGLWIKLGNIIEGLFKTMRQWLEKAGIAVSDFIKATYDVVRTAFNNAWDQTATFFRKLGMNAKDVIVTLWEASKRTWKNMVDYTLNTLKSIGLSIKEWFKFLIEKCKVWIDTIWTLLMKAWKHVAEFINYVKELWIITYERIKQWCNNQVEKITLFIRTAIDACKATRNNLVEWCGGKVEQIKNILVELYWKTKEWLKNLIRFIWWAVLEAWKFILQLWIAVPALMVLVLKELWEWLAAITKLFVETLVKYGKMAVSALCDALTEAFGKTKEMIIRIWQAVANFLRSSAESIRAWILKKTNDAVQAIKAMESYINEKIGDLCNWLYEQWLAVKDIAKTIMTAFKWQAKAIVAWVKAFYDLCKNKLNMGRSEFKKAWNSGVESAADYLTID